MERFTLTARALSTALKAAKLNAREMSAMKRKMLDAFGSCMDELNEDASRRAGACFGAMQAVKSVVRSAAVSAAGD